MTLSHSNNISVDNLGNLTEGQLVLALRAIKVSGTLFLERSWDARLILLHNGRTQLSIEIPVAEINKKLDKTSDDDLSNKKSEKNANINLKQRSRRFTLYLHETEEGETGLPQLPSAYPKSKLALLQATPQLTSNQYWQRNSFKLETYITEQTSFTGLLIIETCGDTIGSETEMPSRGYVVFTKGNVVAVGIEFSKGSVETTYDNKALNLLTALKGKLHITRLALASFIVDSLLSLHGELPESIEQPDLNDINSAQILFDEELNSEFDDDLDIDFEQEIDKDIMNSFLQDGTFELHEDALTALQEKEHETETKQNKKPQQISDKTEINQTDFSSNIIVEDDGYFFYMAGDVSLYIACKPVISKGTYRYNYQEKNQQLELNALDKVKHKSKDENLAKRNAKKETTSHSKTNGNSKPTKSKEQARTNNKSKAKTNTSVSNDKISMVNQTIDTTIDEATKHFRLTLRGQDALSPMTELYQTVQKEFGIGSKTILNALRTTQSITELEKLEPDPNILNDLLRRLELAGLIYETTPYPRRFN